MVTVHNVRIRSDEAAVYEVLDKFVGWASSLQVHVKGSESAIQLMPHTIHRYVEGTKSFLRYHGVAISEDEIEKYALLVLQLTHHVVAS